MIFHSVYYIGKVGRQKLRFDLIKKWERKRRTAGTSSIASASYC